MLIDRVQETTSTDGTGELTLSGAVLGYQSFVSGVGQGNTCYYCCNDENTGDWEVGVGTVGANTLSRDTVLASSNSDALVNFSTNIKFIFVTFPASKSVYQNASGEVGIGGAAVSGYPLSLYQTDDTKGLMVNEVSGGNYLNLYIDANHVSAIKATSNIRLNSGNRFYFVGYDTSLFQSVSPQTTRLSIDHRATPSTGRLVIPEDSTNAIVLGAGNDAEIGFNGTDVVCGLSAGALRIDGLTYTRDAQIIIDSGNSNIASISLRRNNSEKMLLYANGSTGFVGFDCDNTYGFKIGWIAYAAESGFTVTRPDTNEVMISGSRSSSTGVGGPLIVTGGNTNSTYTGGDLLLRGGFCSGSGDHGIVRIQSSDGTTDLVAIDNSGNVGIGGSAVSGYPLALYQGTNTYAQRIYSENQTGSLLLSITDAGTGGFRAASIQTVALAGEISFETSTGQHWHAKAGNHFLFRDIDVGGVPTRLIIDSAATPATGRLVIPEDNTNAIVLGAGNDFSMGYSGSNLDVNLTGSFYIRSGNGLIVEETTTYRGSIGNGAFVSSPYGGSGGKAFIGQTSSAGRMYLADSAYNVNVDIRGSSSGYMSIGGTAVSGYPLSAYQSADSQGIKLFGYDDQSSASSHFYISGAGTSYWVANEQIYIQSASHATFSTGSNMIFTNAAGAIYFDTPTFFSIRDKDDTWATRLTIDSAATPATGRIVIPEDSTNAIVLGAGNDASIGFNGTTMLVTAGTTRFVGSVHVSGGGAVLSDLYQGYSGSSIVHYIPSNTYERFVLSNSSSDFRVVDASNNIEFLVSDGGVGIGGVPVADYPLTMYQSNDLAGLRIYDVDGTNSFRAYTRTTGHTYLTSDAGNIILDADTIQINSDSAGVTYIGYNNCGATYINRGSIKNIYCFNNTSGNPSLYIYGKDGTDQKYGFFQVSSGGAFCVNSQSGESLLLNANANPNYGISISAATGNVNIYHDNQKLTFGASADADSYIQYTGTYLHGYSSTRFILETGNYFELVSDNASYSLLLRNSGNGIGSGGFASLLANTDGLTIGLSGTDIMYIASTGVNIDGPIEFAPDSTAEPTDNGDLVVEATSNTTLTFKLKGTDGTTRSGTLTLS